MGQFWPPPPARTEALTLTRGVTPAGSMPPTVTLYAGIVTVAGRVGNGNGLTLPGSLQAVTTLPAWALPSAFLPIPSAPSGAAAQITAAGVLSVSSPSDTVAVAFCYPLT